MEEGGGGWVIPATAMRARVRTINPTIMATKPAMVTPATKNFSG